MLAAAVVAAPAPAGRSVTAAPILPEVHRHMEQAHNCLQKGSHQLAAAHAGVILVADDIKVFVRFENVPESQRRDCERALAQAFDTWEEALDDTFSFVEVDTAEEANVTIRFRPDVRMGREPVAGFVNWKRTIKSEGDKVVSTGYTADMQLRTSNIDWRPMSVSAMHHEACHELGHVLGLDDSDRVGDLMGPLDVRRPVNHPSVREVTAVRSLRNEARKIIDDSAKL